MSAGAGRVDDQRRPTRPFFEETSRRAFELWQEAGRPEERALGSQTQRHPRRAYKLWEGARMPEARIDESMSSGMSPSGSSKGSWSSELKTPDTL